MEWFKWAAILQVVITSMAISCFEDSYFSKKSPNRIYQNLLEHGLERLSIFTCIWLGGGGIGGGKKSRCAGVVKLCEWAEFQGTEMDR